MTTLSGKLDATRILFDLQQANEIAQSFSGCLNPDAIARCVTAGLVERFPCAFARIWLLEADQAVLRLVASSGMYTHTDGFFARVPMGAYKVGKIAQNRMSFLSNNLPAESWVGNREWAVANQIRGFAGYPLLIGDRVIGVLAMFSHQALEPEFLEVLQTLCTIATITLDTALQCQKERQSWLLETTHPARPAALSDQLAEILSDTRLTLVGTERTLAVSHGYVLLKTAELLKELRCAYGRLIYGEDQVTLEAILPQAERDPADCRFQQVRSIVSGLGGQLQVQITPDRRARQLSLQLPDQVTRSGLRLQIRCIAPVLQLAFTQLALAAGLRVCDQPEAADPTLPLLTDDPTQLDGDRPILWIQQGRACPTRIQAKIDLSIQPAQLQQAVTAVTQGQTWGLPANALSERELEILLLLTQGHRDRDIADRLVISESTVKFHLNNVLAKLKARTRYQAIYEAIEQGWI